MEDLSAFFTDLDDPDAYDLGIKVPGRKPVCKEHWHVVEQGDSGLLGLVEFTEECLGETDDPDCLTYHLFHDQGLPEETDYTPVPGRYLLAIEWIEEGNYWTGTLSVPNLVMAYPEEVEWTTN